MRKAAANPVLAEFPGKNYQSFFYESIKKEPH